MPLNRITGGVNRSRLGRALLPASLSTVKFLVLLL